MHKTVDKKELRGKLATAILILILCGIFAGGFIWGLNKVLAMEGAYPPEEDTRGIFSKPLNAADAIALLDTVTAKALAEKPKAVTRERLSLDKASIATDGSEQLRSSLALASEGFVNYINTKLYFSETDFSAEPDVSRPKITAEDIVSLDCKYFDRNYVYQCDSCGREADAMSEGCPACSSPNLYTRQLRQNYVVELTLKNDESLLSENYPPRETQAVLDLLEGNTEGVLKIDELSQSCRGLYLKLEIDRSNGKLLYLEIKKDISVSAEAVFTDSFIDLGRANISFDATESLRSDFSWPSLKLSAEELIIEPKGKANLTATLTCSDPTLPVVTWTSSDENVVTVDEEGYLQAAKTSGEAIITASFDFLGKTYTDSCKIKVAFPVESMSISKRSLSLSVGESRALSAQVSPKNATIQTKKWYSLDESIAVVDQDGVVTAVASGAVEIYALSDDGYYKSSCEVTVK